MSNPKWLLVLALGTGLTLSGPIAYAHLDDEEEITPAPGATWEPETCVDDAECGDMMPLIPMTYNAVGAGIVWTDDNWDVPKIQYKGRHSEFKPTDLYDEDCMEDLVLLSGYSAWPIPRSEWDPQFPPANPAGPVAAPPGPVVQTFAEWNDPLSAYNIFFDAQRVTRQDPIGVSHQTKSINVCKKSSFKHLVYGGYNIHQGQSQFVGDRIRAYWHKENSQLWDLSHPDAFKNRGIFDNARLDEEDALMNLASFVDAGASRGLNYSIYSLGYATLADGRVVNVGGHNMQSNNGFRKLNIYDPNTNSWADRGLPCNIRNWRNDPGGEALGYQAFADAHAGGPGLGERLGNPPPGAPMWSDCNMRLRDHVDPPHSSDMRYPRWYPSAVTMPDGRVLIYGGDDLDESYGPDESIVDNVNRNAAFGQTQIIVPVPEIYDPKTDTTIALENARKIYPLYPMATAVQTGPGKDDWAICTFTGESAPAEQATVPRSDAIDEATEWRNFCDTPGCSDDTRAIRLLGQRPASSLDCLDVLAAEADPNRNIPAENHWTHIDSTEFRYPYCCGMTTALKIGPDGKTQNHFFFVIGGQTPPPGPGIGSRQPAIELIDFAEPDPEFRRMVDMWQPVGGGPYVTMLPDGTAIINDGAGPGGGGYEAAHNTKYQLFDPFNNTIRTLAKSTFASSNFHCTMMLLHDATTINMGCDRANLNPAGNRMFPPGDQDLGVSNAQIFKPPYLFEQHEHDDPADETGHHEEAVRPVIKSAPKHITYGQKFTLHTDNAADVKMVSMVRTGFVTHTLVTDNRLVITHFKRPGNSKTLVVDAPKLPAQAIPGDYMVFLVNEEGTPSIAKRVRLQ